MNCCGSEMLVSANTTQLDSKKAFPNLFLTSCISKCICTPFKSWKKRQRDILSAWSTGQPRNTLPSSSPFRREICTSPLVHQIRRILRAFWEDCAEEVTWEQRCFWHVILRKYKVTCVNFWEISLLFFFTPKGLKPCLFDCFTEQGVLVLPRIYR